MLVNSAADVATFGPRRGPCVTPGRRLNRRDASPVAAITFLIDSEIMGARGRLATALVVALLCVHVAHATRARQVCYITKWVTLGGAVRASRRASSQGDDPLALLRSPCPAAGLR